MLQELNELATEFLGVIVCCCFSGLAVFFNENVLNEAWAPVCFGAVELPMSQVYYVR